MRFLIGIFLTGLCFGQGVENRATTGTRNDSALKWIAPTVHFAGLPAGSALPGQRLTVDDCSSSSCTGGGGNIKADLRWNGATWDVISGGSGGSQTNSLASGGGALFQRSIDCNTSTISLSGSTWTYPAGTVAGAAAVTQEFPIITGLNGNQRYDHVQISEHVQFASGSVTGVKVSIGRPGSSTNDEMLAQTPLMQSGGDAWFAFDRPQPPVLLPANTYTLVLALRTTGGNVSALTAGAVSYEVCGYAAQ